MTVLAVAETRQGEVRDVSYEVVAAAQEIREATGGELHLAVINGDVDRFAEELDVEGVDVIHKVDEGDEFNHGVYTEAVTQIYESIDASDLVVPHSVNGMDYAAAVAGRLDLPLVTDTVDLEAGDHLTATREMYGSKVETDIEIQDDEVAVAVRPAEWDMVEEEGDAEIKSFDADINADSLGTNVTGFEEVAGGDVDLGEAEFIISIGRGIDEEENLELIEELCEATGAVMGSSRPLVDNEWLPKNRQVGQSGKVVTPKIYVAIGISGAVQHVAGMKGSDTIIAINTDPSAPIFDIADYGVVGDLFDVVPALTEQFQ